MHRGGSTLCLLKKRIKKGGCKKVQKEHFEKSFNTNSISLHVDCRMQKKTYICLISAKRREGGGLQRFVDMSTKMIFYTTPKYYKTASENYVGTNYKSNIILGDIKLCICSDGQRERYLLR